MIKMIKNNKIVIALTLAIACLFTFCLQSIYTSRQTSNSLASIRTIETTQNELDIQSIFEQFEDASLETQGSITTFEGTKAFSLLDFYEYDLVSDFAPELESAEIKVKYRYDYDSEAKIITLTASMYDDNNTSTDTLIGVPFVNDKGNLDCVFDCDGEYILLSELQDAGLIENCGWFKNLCKKVSSAVQKVTNTVVGKVGATLTVAVPLVIGVVAGVMAAPVLPVIAAGALVGAGIAAGTAMISTHQQDGKIDWETVGICAGVGAAVGAIVSGAAYGITTLIKSATQVSSALKNIETNRRTHILQDKHGWSNLGDNTWDTVSSAIKHTLKNGSVSSYQAGNEIITATYKGQTVQVVVREVDKALRIVDAWIKLL